jgi:hypothetical protein
MSQQAAIRVVAGLLAVAFVVLFVLVGTSPEHFVYDEPPFVEYVPLLHKYGLSTAFLNSLTGTVGPLYAFVQGAFEQVTGLHPVAMRLVNLALLAGVAGLLAAWLKRCGSPAWAASALSVVAVPMAWVMAGMALSEMPALFFVAVSLCLQLMALEAAVRPRSVVVLFALSGVALGIAVWGRQPYLLLGGVPVVLALLERRLRPAVVLFCVIVLGLSLPQFLIWKGLVPPSHQERVQQGLAPLNALLSLGYTGLCFFLLAPMIRWISATSAAALVVVAVVANATLDLVSIAPLRPAVERYASGRIATIYAELCGSLFLAVGLIFLAWLLRTTWKGRNDLRVVLVNLGLLGVALSPVFIGHQYSSRYTAMSLPYMILAAEPWRRWGVATVVTSIVGVVIGVVSLSGYFTQ